MPSMRSGPYLLGRRRTVRVPRRSSRSRGRPPSRLDLVEPRATVFSRHLRRSGFAGFQRPTTRALLAAWSLQHPRFVFYDIGANGGLYTALCKLLHPSAVPLAFEPHPDTARYARSVLAVNGLDAEVEQVAVSDRNGRARLHLSPVSDASHSLAEGFREAKDHLVVETVTVDHHAEEAGLPPDVMKIDVELHEDKVLEGARKTIEAHRPLIVAEILKRGPDDTGPAVHGLLEPLGYRAFRLTEPPDWRPAAELRERVGARIGTGCSRRTGSLRDSPRPWRLGIEHSTRVVRRWPHA